MILSFFFSLSYLVFFYIFYYCTLFSFEPLPFLSSILSISWLQLRPFLPQPRPLLPQPRPFLPQPRPFLPLDSITVSSVSPPGQWIFSNDFFQLLSLSLLLLILIFKGEMTSTDSEFMMVPLSMGCMASASRTAGVPLYLFLLRSRQETGLAISVCWLLSRFLIASLLSLTMIVLPWTFLGAQLLTVSKLRYFWLRINLVRDISKSKSPSLTISWKSLSFCIVEIIISYSYPIELLILLFLRQSTLASFSRFRAAPHASSYNHHIGLQLFQYQTNYTKRDFYHEIDSIPKARSYPDPETYPKMEKHTLKWRNIPLNGGTQPKMEKEYSLKWRRNIGKSYQIRTKHQQASNKQALMKQQRSNISFSSLSISLQNRGIQQQMRMKSAPY